MSTAWPARALPDTIAYINIIFDFFRMRQYHAIFVVILILAFGSVSFAKNCGGATICNCSDYVNESYVMTEDLKNSTGGALCPGPGLSVASGVTLDCDGYSIIGDGSGALDYGIDDSSFGSPVIKNCNVLGFERGIYLGFGAATILVNNEVHDNYGYGIYTWFPAGPVINDTHLFNNSIDYDHYIGSSDGPLTVNNMTFDRNLGDMTDETSISFYQPAGAFVDNAVSIDHASSAGNPSGYAAFGGRYLNFSPGWSSQYYFNSINWTWDGGEDDSGGVELWRKNLSDSTWYLVSAAGDETNNILSLTNHNDTSGDTFIYGLFKPVGATPLTGCQEINASGDYTWNNPPTSAGIAFSTITPVNEVGFSKACIVITANNVKLTCNEAPSSSLINGIVSGGYPTGVFIYAPSVQNLELNNCDIEGRVGGVVAVARAGASSPLPGNIVIDGSDADYAGAMANSPSAYTFVDVQGLTITDSNVDGGDITRMGFDLVRVVGANLTNLSISGVNNPTSNLKSSVQPALGETDYGGLRIYGSSDVQVSTSNFYDNWKDVTYRGTELDLLQTVFKQSAVASSEDSLLDITTTSSVNFALDGDKLTSSDVRMALRPVGNKSVLIEKTNPASSSIVLDTIIYHWEDAVDEPDPANWFDQYRVFSDFTDEKLGATVDDQARTAIVSSHTVTENKEYLGLFAEITECTDIAFPGTYYIDAQLPGTQSGKDYCLGVTADDVTINSLSEAGTWILGSGIGTAILVSGTTDTTVIGKGSKISGYETGIEFESAKGARVDPIFFCNNTIGVLVNNSNDSIIDDVVACNNTQYGIYVLDSDNTTVLNSRTYNNSVDLRVENNLGSAVTLNVTSLVFDNPSGNLQNYTDVYLSDSVAASTAYEINWSALPAALDAGVLSMGNKYIDISGTGSIDTIRWHWLDTESIFQGYDETLLDVWEYTSSWAALSATLDSVNNFLSVSGLSPSSQYGILHNGTSLGAPATLYGANVTNMTHIGRFVGTAAGNLSTEGGNVSGVNISSTQLTERWAAFFGNVVGNIFLNDLSGTNVYSWSWNPASGGAVCISTNSSINAFTAYPALGSEIDSAWGFNPLSTDSGTRTFNATNCSLSIGPTTINNASVADTGAVGGFQTCAIKSAVPSPVKDEVLFCSQILAAGTFYNGGTGNYEIMAPTNVSGTETYYFYANLD